MTHQADKAVPVHEDPGTSTVPPRRRASTGTILTLVNGVLAGVGGVYIRTHSVLITVIAAAASIVLAALVLITRG
jgi:hypothetical protein